MEAPGGAAVLGGVDERQRAQRVLQQAAGQRVRTLAAQPHARAQDALQLPSVLQQLFAIHAGYLQTTHTHAH